MGELREFSSLFGKHSAVDLQTTQAEIVIRASGKLVALWITKRERREKGELREFSSLFGKHNSLDLQTMRAEIDDKSQRQTGCL